MRNVRIILAVAAATEKCENYDSYILRLLAVALVVAIGKRENYDSCILGLLVKGVATEECENQDQYIKIVSSSNIYQKM
jgi:hypothetical protein